LDSLVRIETFQWVTSDVLRKFFRARFLVITAAYAATVGRFVLLSTPPDGKIFSGVDFRDFLLQSEPGRSLVLKRFDHATAACLWQDIVGDSDSRISGDGVDGAPRDRFGPVNGSSATSLAYAAMGAAWFRLPA
jgi:hypothetical protein